MIRRVRRIAPRLVWPALLIASVLLFHARAVRPGAAFDAPDLGEYFVPIRSLVLELASRGELPFWQRSVDAGFPMLASSEMALFHPTTWLFAFTRTVERGLTLGLLAHLCVAAVATFVWQRRRGRSSGAAATAAVIVALGGFTTVHLEHWTFSASLVWLPIALLAVDGFLESGRVRWFALAAVAMAGTWYGGAAQLAYFSSLLVGGYALFRGLAPERLRRVAIVLCVPAGMLLASPVIFATAELSALGPRAAGTTLEYAGFWYRLTDVKQLALFLLPNTYGPPRAWSGPMPFHEMSGYVGVGALALIFAARPRGIGWFFVAVIVVSVLASFGMTFGFWEVLHRYLPGYASFRVPTRAFFLVNVAAAFLAAEAVDRLVLQRRLRADLAIVAVTVALGAVCLWIGESAGKLGFRAETLGNARWACGVLAAIAVLVVLRRVVPAPLVAAALALVTFVDLRHGFAEFMPVVPAEQLAARWPKLPSGTNEHPRVAAIRLPLNIAARQALESPHGYTQIMIGRVFDLLNAARSGHFNPAATTPISNEYGHQDIAPYQPLFPLWSVSRIVSAYPLQHPTLRSDGRGEMGLFHYTALSSLPIAFWSAQHRVLDDPGFQKQAASFKPHTDLFVAPSDVPLPASKPGLPRVAAHVVERTSNRTELKVHAPDDGLLVLLDPWFPGWSATVDGAEAPIVRANYAFMAVPVTKGEHTVRVSYFPRTLPYALACIGAIVAALAGWALWRRRRARPSWALPTAASR